jgi:predicted N-acetyltransferase YhbS
MSLSDLRIRVATRDDAEAITVLLAQLGHAADAETVVARLSRLAKADNNAVLVAEQDGGIVGLIGLHWLPLLHRPAPLGRITVLIVREEARRQGIGRLLVERAAEVFREAGCGSVEVTSNLRRTEAHAFYKRLGFETPSAYFRQSLG